MYTVVSCIHFIFYVLYFLPLIDIYDCSNTEAEIFIQVDEENSQDMIPVETEDGQMVYLPIEYLDNDLYDSLFDTDSEASVTGSFPSLPPDDLEKWKKKMSAKVSEDCYQKTMS